MNADMFWERSWKSFDPQRIPVFAGSADTPASPIIPYLKARGVRTVCDAGCGCGLFLLALSQAGFTVSGFDLASEAVSITERLLRERGISAPELCTADVRSTPYADGTFDAAVARSVLDHMPVKEGTAAAAELLRIVRPGGCVLLTLDKTDDEYENAPHETSAEGDYVYTSGKWKGMVFCPYSEETARALAHGCRAKLLASTESDFTIAIEKPLA